MKNFYGIMGGVFLYVWAATFVISFLYFMWKDVFAALSGHFWYAANFLSALGLAMIPWIIGVQVSKLGDKYKD